MNRIIPYSRPPFSKPFILLGLVTITLLVWLRSDTNSDLLHLIFLSSSYLTWWIFIPIIYGIIVNFRSRVSIIPILIVQLITLIIAHFILSNILYYSILSLIVEGYEPLTFEILKQIILPSTLLRVIDLILFFGILSWAYRSKQLDSKKLELAEIEADLSEAKLKTLKSQLNPHFLFNTLHMISSLIGTDEEKARNITIKVSDLLRKVLITNTIDSHSLVDELLVVKSYLAIEMERFNDRLLVKESIDEDVMSINVPSFILQPLIENAFKHGISQVEGKAKLTINISKTEDGKYLSIEITNDLPSSPGKNNIESTGIGIVNLKSRLDNFYKGNYSYSSYTTKENEYIVQLKLPMDR